MLHVRNEISRVHNTSLGRQKMDAVSQLPHVQLPAAPGPYLCAYCTKLLRTSTLRGSPCATIGLRIRGGARRY